MVPLTSRSARARDRAVLVIALVTLVLGMTAFTATPITGSSSSNSVSAPAIERHETSRKPTVILVHGAWADSSGWAAQVNELTKRGYEVIAAANPLRTLASDSDYLSSLISQVRGPVVLVGHSYGGAVITNAAVGHRNVKALVYVAGWAPAKGESLGQLAGMNPGSLINPDTLVFRRYTEGNRGEGSDTYISEKVFRRAFAGDLSKTRARAMEATQRPFAAEVFEEPAGRPAYKRVDSWYLLATKDRAIPPATQRFMAKRAGSRITKVAASHVAFISKPHVTTGVILKAIRSVR